MGVAFPGVGWVAAGRGRARGPGLSLPAAGGGGRVRRRRRLWREQHGLGHRAVGESARPVSKFLTSWDPDSPAPFAPAGPPRKLCASPSSDLWSPPLSALSRSFPGRFRMPGSEERPCGSGVGKLRHGA